MEDNQDVDDELDIESNINVEEDENKSDDKREIRFKLSFSQFYGIYVRNEKISRII